jgi:hypothetical protein
MAVDMFSTGLDDDDAFADLVDAASVADLLTALGGLAVAVGLDHPHTPEVLRLLVDHLQERTLARQLRRVLPKYKPARTPKARPSAVRSRVCDGGDSGQVGVGTGTSPQRVDRHGAQTDPKGDMPRPARGTIRVTVIIEPPGGCGTGRNALSGRQSAAPGKTLAARCAGLRPAVRDRGDTAEQRHVGAERPRLRPRRSPWLQSRAARSLCRGRCCSSPIRRCGLH